MLLCPAIAAAAIAFTQADADISYSTAAALCTNHVSRDAGTAAGARAANFILRAATRAGGDARADRFEAQTPLGPKFFSNVYAAFPGKTGKWVVFISHFDTKRGAGCPGANDGASTSGLLTGLCAAFARAEDNLPYGCLLVWTDGEECFKSYSPGDGLWGAKRAVSKIAAKKLEIEAVICLDMLGDADLNISIPRNTTPRLAAAALAAAEKTGAKDKISTIGQLMIDDHVPFLEADYPAVNLIDFDFGNKGESWWHTGKDTLDKISAASLYCAGRIAAEMYNALSSGAGGKEQQKADNYDAVSP